MKFPQSQPLALGQEVPFKEAERSTPAYTLQAVIAALLLCLGMGLVMFYAILGLAIWLGWKPEWKAAMGFSGLFMGGLAIYWAFSGAEGVMWQVEKVTGQDIMIPDGYVGQPPGKPEYHQQRRIPPLRSSRARPRGTQSDGHWVSVRQESSSYLPGSAHPPVLPGSGSVAGFLPVGADCRVCSVWPPFAA